MGDEQDRNEWSHLSCSLGSTLRDSMNALFLLITARGDDGGERQRAKSEERRKEGNRQRKIGE